MSLFWIPLFLGAVEIGFNLIQAILVNQVCRDAGHMYAYGVDFSQTSNKYLLASFAPRFNIDPTGSAGNGEVILSMIDYVDDAQCQAGGYSMDSACPNYGKDVITRQIVIGKTLKSSAFGTPSTAITNSSTGVVQSGSPSTPGYLNDASALAPNFSTLITLSSGATGQQYAYVSEMFVKSASFNWYFVGTPWISSRNVF